MKHTILAFIIFILGCSKKQEHKTNILTVNELKQKRKVSQKYSLVFTNECEQTNLSKSFDLYLNFKRYSNSSDSQDSCITQIYLKDKAKKSIIDSLSLSSFYFYPDVFVSCDSMTSYSTKFNSDREIVDNYFGDIVVADFNFDKKDDLAVMNDIGGNGGPLYSYFIQTNERKFILDNYLTDSVVWFPTKVVKSKKRLITYVHAGACCVSENIYQYDATKTRWKQISQKTLGR